MDLEHADRAALVAEHSEEIVRKSYELWGMLIQKIPYVPIMRMILSAGSHQEGWACFRKYYETRAGSEKAALSVCTNARGANDKEEVASKILVPTS